MHAREIDSIIKQVGTYTIEDFQKCYGTLDELIPGDDPEDRFIKEKIVARLKSSSQSPRALLPESIPVPTTSSTAAADPAPPQAQATGPTAPGVVAKPEQKVPVPTLPNTCEVEEGDAKTVGTKRAEPDASTGKVITFGHE